MEQERRRGAQRPYPRMARVNALLHEVLAEQLARDADVDERLGIATITGVDCSPDLKLATVYFSSLSEELALALEEHRRGLQSALGEEVRIRRTPTLRFLADPAVAAGNRIEAAILRSRRRGESS
ncbi:MAG TPA: ribosome-binding factor A [Acidimicrobiales bacterium]